MSEKERTSILKIITESSGYDIALMTSFNFEIDYFERAILSQLTARNVKTISMYIDADEFSAVLSEVDSSYLGRRYMVNPVKLNGAFHPKVVLLLGKKKAKLVVSSANIKTSGYTINNELFGCVTYDPKHPEYLDVICDAIDFFLELDNMSYHLDSEIIEDIKDLPYYRKTPKNAEIKLIHNLRDPILTQLTDLIPESIESILIAVPYYDKNLGALLELKAAFPDASINLFIQNVTSTFPKEYDEEHHISDRIFVFGSFSDNGSEAFYHGKTFLLKSKVADYILYGSANCTQAALNKTHTDRGNVECCFLAKSKPGDFDYFFDNMKPTTREEFSVNSMCFEPNTRGSICFKYCEVKEGVILHFGASNGIRPNASINSMKLECTYKDGDLLIVLSKDVLDELNDLFDVEFTYDDTVESVRCWIYNPEMLRSFRSRTFETNGIDSFDIDSKDDKYLQDRINLLNAEQTCLPEVEEYRKQLAYYNQVRRQQDEGAGDDEDYIIEVEIPEDYKFKYRTYQKVASIRNQILGKLFGRYHFLFSDESSPKSNSTKVSKPVKVPNNLGENAVPKRRAPTTDEKRFNRFVASKINGMLDSKYIAVIEPPHLLSLIQVIDDIFNKYRFVDLFDVYFVVESRTELYKLLLTKDLSDCEEENLEYMVLLECYKAIAENYLLIVAEKEMESREELNSASRELLVAMDRKYEIRSDYEDHISDLMKTEDPELKPIYETVFSTYIEGLFGYKNLGLLEEYISSLYDDPVIAIDDKQMKILCKTDNIKQQLNLNRELIREIRDYAEVYGRIDSVFITILNKDTKSKVGLNSLEHEYNYRTHYWICIASYKNGMILQEKPEFIAL